MESSLDEFSDLQTKLNGVFKRNWDFSSPVVKTRSLVDVNRDLLFSWNGKDSNVFVVNVSVLTGRNAVNCTQHLELTAPPDFPVERVRVNDTGSHLALVGPRGACVVQLPGRWGASGLFADGRPSVICQSCSVDASLFMRSPSLELLELRWCPPPLPDQLFVVLLSNNTLRLYRAAEPDTSLQEWRVGRPLGRGQLMDPAPSGERRLLPLLAALGHTAVSFDFLPPLLRSSLRPPGSQVVDVSLFRSEDRAWGSSTPLPPRNAAQDSPPDGDTEQQDKDEVCALAVLFGQGDVYIVVPPNFSATAPCTERAGLFGPLRMRPCSLDNLGAESCSLTVLQVQPPVLVMASATGGTTYHGLLLTVPRNFDFNISGAESDVDSVVGAEECGKFLRLVEKVKLNISMGVGGSEVEDPSAFECPLLLSSDPASPSRYYCSHAGGLHCVTLPLVQELQKFNANQCTLEEAMKALPKNGVASRIHYLLCTQLATQHSAQPLQGFAPLPLTSAGLALLPRPSLVPLPCLAVPPDSRALFSDSLHVLENKVDPKSQHEGNFEERVRCLLQHNCTQPLLRLPPGTKLSNRDFLDLLKKSIAVLRTEYLAKLNVVHEEIKHKRSMLEKTQDMRLRQFQELKVDVLSGLEKQKRIRVKMQAAIELGKENLRRLKEVALRERLSQPKMSEAEEQMAGTLDKHKAKVDAHKDTMTSLTARMNTVLQRREETRQGAAEAEYFSDKEVKEYRATCTDISKRINTLTSSLNHMQSHLQRIRLHSARMNTSVGDMSVTAASP